MISFLIVSFGYQCEMNLMERVIEWPIIKDCVCYELRMCTGFVIVEILFRTIDIVISLILYCYITNIV